VQSLRPGEAVFGVVTKAALGGGAFGEYVTAPEAYTARVPAGLDLAQCFERGAVRPCFVPDPEFRIIRLHTRYRRDLTDERTREKNRTEKLLESAAIKVSSVITDLHGVTGRDIMDHLIAGVRVRRRGRSLPRRRRWPGR
jgi:hypothetical protein